jgi:hypothetical protein
VARKNDHKSSAEMPMKQPKDGRFDLAIHPDAGPAAK